MERLAGRFAHRRGDFPAGRRLYPLSERLGRRLVHAGPSGLRGSSWTFRRVLHLSGEDVPLNLRMTRRDLPGLSFAGPTTICAAPAKRCVVVLMLDGFGLKISRPCGHADDECLNRRRRLRTRESADATRREYE